MKEEAAPVTMGEVQFVQCVSDRRRISLAAAKRILLQGDPPFQAFRFPAPHPPDLHPGLTGSVAQGWAVVPGQSLLIVPLCYSNTVLPPRGPGQGKHCVGCIDGVCFESVCEGVLTPISAK